MNDGVLLFTLICILQGVALKNNSDAFDTWKDPPAPIYMSFYLYDVVNSAEVLNNGSKPSLVQRGPYVYKYVEIPPFCSAILS